MITIAAGSGPREALTVLLAASKFTTRRRRARHVLMIDSCPLTQPLMTSDAGVAEHALEIAALV